ncbi:glycoside hydrolase superfamily [Gilbertella persicaria]|uniref:glycoside hydrolase superfamily n=1 Tax=Gilbertella persicaria TaxID=101096 RepID=UPI00221ECF37|nr:glycoside hydrolase superfamily [Gilbertella persicaria]KAI8053165.1 glycoside hydrolase superfamily [Gilbertella persicaria]
MQNINSEANYYRNRPEAPSWSSVSSRETNVQQQPAKDPDQEKPLTAWQRFKQNKTRVALLVTLATLVLLAIIIVPIVVCGIVTKEQNKETPRMITPTSSDYRDPFDDSARPNNFTPPLNQQFRYTQDPVRGINLGGWLVLEPFITPKIFEQKLNETTLIDEWELCEALGPEEAKRQLTHHYDTFITEADFKKIAEMGFNHVRIPTGHWAIKVMEGEPFVPYVSWQYLLKGIQWARKYGLRVMVELHTAPGSQNGWNHSGKSGPVGFLNGTHGEENADKTIKVVNEMIQFFTKPEWSNVVPVFGVLNEPAMIKIPEKKVRKWYETSYEAIRKMLGPGNGPYLTYHDGFYPLKYWEGFFGPQREKAILETHLYLIFNNGLVSMPRSQQVEFPCTAWKNDLENASKNISPTLVGEFSVATNDCAKYLNGIGMGARYDGTLGDPPQPVCPDCTCQGADDWHKFTDEYKLFLLKFMEKQMDAYETSAGWFYWTYKTEDHINPHWDYLLAWEQGFAPKDVNVREYSCKTSKSSPEEE